jgi:prepilin-type N-terminal cleavage/methylation domain-containing protein
MRSFSKYILFRIFCKSRGFSLIEIVASLIILALICSSVFVVIDRCLTSTADLTLRMQAFEVARENMETLLSRASVKEKVDYGTSKKYPHINWETSVEVFDEPINSEMWVRAVCSAQYIDSEGNDQKVELTHWLTNISKRQMMDILKQLDKREKILTEQLIATISEAAAYASVPPETIQMWIDNGMPTASNGAFIKDMLDLYNNSQGYPSQENLNRIQKKIVFLTQSLEAAITTSPTGSDVLSSLQSSQGQGPPQGGQDQPSQRDSRGRSRPPDSGEQLYFGMYTEEDIRNMSFGQIWKLLMEHYGN